MINDHLFLISKNNLLICMDIVSGNIIYSYDINEKIADFINTKKRKVEFKEIVMVNSKIFIFLKNSYVLKFNVDGFTTVEEPRDSTILETLAVTSGSFEVPRGKVTSLCLIILLSSGIASIKGIFSIASPEN